MSTPMGTGLSVSEMRSRRASKPPWLPNELIMSSRNRDMEYVMGVGRNAQFSSMRGCAGGSHGEFGG